MLFPNLVEMRLNTEISGPQESTRLCGKPNIFSSSKHKGNTPIFNKDIGYIDYIGVEGLRPLELNQCNAT